MCSPGFCVMIVSLLSMVLPGSLRVRAFTRRTYAYFRFSCGGLKYKCSSFIVILIVVIIWLVS
jgi:hypothetical protein